MSDALAELLSRGERAAFHGPPASGTAVLQQAVVDGRAAGRDAEAAMAAWLLGVCLSATGRWGSALTILRPMLLAGPEADQAPERRLVASLAASTTASVHRQLGRHDVARAFDEQALALGSGSAEAEFDAYVGLAADAVGAGDIAVVDGWLTKAAVLAEPRSDWWRQRVRLDWTRAEVALLRGAADEAAVRASAALARAEAAGAPRHVAKSLLFLSVSLLERGDLPEATASLRRTASLAESLGTLPVMWPAKALLGALTADSEPAASAQSLHEARAAINVIADDLPGAAPGNPPGPGTVPGHTNGPGDGTQVLPGPEPDDLRSAWLARDDVAALLAP